MGCAIQAPCAPVLSFHYRTCRLHLYGSGAHAGSNGAELSARGGSDQIFQAACDIAELRRGNKAEKEREEKRREESTLSGSCTYSKVLFAGRCGCSTCCLLYSVDCCWCRCRLMSCFLPST